MSGAVRQLRHVPGTVRVVDDVPAAFAEAVADAFATRVGSPTSRFSVALSGGPLARRCYQRLAHEAAAAVDWTLVDVLLGDERCVPPDHPDANQRLVREVLLAAVGPVGSFSPMDCDTGPEAYQRLVERHAPLDLVHLGFGEDGHTASLFPGSPVLHTPPGRLVARSVDPAGNNDHPRLTFTFEALAAARLRLVTASGPAKRDAFRRLQAGEDLPAARLPAEQTLWLVDQAVVG